MIKAVLFDVDGVLADTLKANCRYYGDLLESHGYRRPTLAQYHRAFYLPTLEAIAALSHEKDVKKLEQMALFSRTRRGALYHYELVRAPPGAQDAITKLHRNYRLGIVTSRIRTGVGEVIDPFYRRVDFSVIVAREDYARMKPSPDSLLAGAKRLGLKPGEVVYVGDSKTDMQAAHSAGMKAIGFSKTRLSGADAMAASFSVIPKIIIKWNRTLATL